MIDVLAVVRDMLADDSSVAAIAGDRIWASTIAPAGYSPSQGPAVQLSIRGGTPDNYLPLMRPSVQVRTWADTPAAAWDLMAAIYDRLRHCLGADVDGVTMLAADAETVPQHMRDAGTNWPTVLAFYKFTFRE